MSLVELKIEIKELKPKKNLDPKTLFDNITSIMKKHNDCANNKMVATDENLIETMLTLAQNNYASVLTNQ